MRKGHRAKFIGFTNFRYFRKKHIRVPHIFLGKTSHLSEANEYIRIIHCDKAENGPKDCFSVNNYLNCDLVRCLPPPLDQGILYRHREGGGAQIASLE
jgi:hypothetical protein